MANEVIFDDADVRRMIGDVVKRTKQFKERDRTVIGILSSVIFKDIMRHFDQQQGSEGPWKQWSPRYRKFMESLGKHGGNKILQKSGDLRQSFKPMETGGMVRKTSEGLLWYNNAKTASKFPYAYAHDEGGPILPKRDFMWLSREALDDIEDQIIKFMES